MPFNKPIRLLICVTILAQLPRGPVVGQAQTPAPAGDAAGPAPMKQEELDQLLAPLALYPDSLLSQIFMASTYPLEVVEADRWAKANKALKDDALATALEKQSWDPSVKSLVNFPDVLSMMSEKLDLTTKLGDAFIADSKRMMDTVQKLRAKAKDAGNLKTTEQQKVVVEQAPAGSVTPQVITIEAPSPQVVYVPAYDPKVVYGAWPYPAYPPYPYYPPRPPGWVAGSVIGFGVGVACGAAWGYAWGGCNWGHGDVDIDVDRNVNINNTSIDRSKYKAEINQRNANGQGAGASSFQHDPSHRKGVAYRDTATQQKFAGARSAETARARDDFRGRADAGRQTLSRDTQGGVAAPNRSGGAQDRAAGAAQNRSGAADNRAGDVGNRAQSPSADRNTAGTRSGAFDGMNRSSGEVRAESQRGAASRSAPSGGGARGGGAGRR